MYRLPVFFLLIVGSITSAVGQTAIEIVRKADEKTKGKTSVANITIQTVRPSYTRELTMKSWSKGSSYSMILVTAPAKEKGIVYLKRLKEVWNWIPSIERTVKLPPSMMSQSWMGTDFTNDDLVKEASIVEDYVHTIAGEAVIDGRNCYKIQMIPKPAATVVWGKVLAWIDKKDYLMLRVEYYDEDNELINTLQCSDIKTFGGKLLPGRMEMTPADKKGHKTVLIYNSLVFDKPIEDSFFTSQNMTKVQ
jgi:outer membrane lipoprotein-sorting protein